MRKLKTGYHYINKDNTRSFIVLDSRYHEMHRILLTSSMYRNNLSEHYYDEMMYGYMSIPGCAKGTLEIVPSRNYVQDIRYPLSLFLFVCSMGARL